MNIILNGLQATKGKLVIASGIIGNNIFVQVKDSGAGIPEENLDKLFDPFFTTKDKGTGLGLSITLQIIKAHGGDIKASNRPEGGAEFFITIPVKEHEKQ